MSIKAMGANQVVATLSKGGASVILSDWGESDPPFTVDDAEDRQVMRDGVGGNAITMERVNKPKTATVALNPSSEQAARIRAIDRQPGHWTLVYATLGTAETTSCFDGVITRFGPRGRAGRASITDEVFNFRFRDSEET